MCFFLPCVYNLFVQREDKHVALKVLTAKASDLESESGLEEINILKRVITADPHHNGFNHVVGMLDSFRVEGDNGVHTCLILEAMADNMQGLEAKNENLKVPLAIVKRMTRHVLLALDYCEFRL